MMGTQSARTTVTASDGVALAVHRYTDIDRQRPTILAVHGYPDDHRVWDDAARQLADCYNVVAYDVRGAGESGRPAGRSGYRLRQLVSDIGMVIDSLGVAEVHLLGHDWGSIQCWTAVTDDALLGRIASLTSISGPHLRYAGRFLQSARTPRAVADVVKQFFASSYIWFFLCPGAPEVAIHSGATAKVFAAVGRIGRSTGVGRPGTPPRSIDDYLNGLNLYRANMPGPLLASGKTLPQPTVPVQVLVPRQDYFVSPALQRFTGSIAPGGRVVSIEGGHWVVSARPDVIARLTGQWVELTTNGSAAVGDPTLERRER